MSRDEKGLSIVPLGPEDLPAALGIQSAAYPPFLVEDERAFRSRIDLAASYCLAAKREGVLLGYILAHGWRRGAPPPVGAVLSEGVASEMLYIHDLAVAPAGRGLNIGRRLVAHAFELAARDGLREAELIAVEGAADYWQMLGFGEPPVGGDLAAKLRSYGRSARWMTCRIPPAR